MSWGEQEGFWCIIVHKKEFRKTHQVFFLCQVDLEGKEVKTV